jgi:uncharacterized membrane protein YcaP (DUF421 family)
MSLLSIAVRALFAYAFLLIILRLTGKRTIYQGTPLDFVVALIVGDMIDDLLWAEVPAAQFVVGVGMLFVTHVAVALGVFHNSTFARLVEGLPVAVVTNGAPLRAGMRRERFSLPDLLVAMRQSSVDDLREVENANIEVSGEVSVLPREWAKEAQRQDLERVRKATQ